MLPILVFVLCRKPLKSAMTRVVGRSGLVLAGIMPQTCLALSCAWPASGVVGQLGKVQPGEGRSLGAETSTVIDRTRCLVAPKVFGFQARSGPSWQARVSNSITWTQTHRHSLEWQGVLLKLFDTEAHRRTQTQTGAHRQCCRCRGAQWQAGCLI